MLLLPTDNNKLLMQWKGPYVIQEVVGPNDYKVKVGRGLKTYHANLLKKYVDREEQSTPEKAATACRRLTKVVSTKTFSSLTRSNTRRALTILLWPEPKCGTAQTSQKAGERVRGSFYTSTRNDGYRSTPSQADLQHPSSL